MDEEKSNEARPRKETSRTSEPLTGRETAKVIAEIYHDLGAENGCLFVAPNAILGFLILVRHPKLTI
jgi:hypothetical protein